jgi:hypothetical protein
MHDPCEGMQLHGASPDFTIESGTQPLDLIRTLPLQAQSDFSIPDRCFAAGFHNRAGDRGQWRTD